MVIRITAMKLSNIEAWNLKNVTGFNVLNNSITQDKLTDDVGKQALSDTLSDSKAYTNGSIITLNNSLRSWVNANFQPIS